MFNRVILLVLDGCGIGALPDAAEYGDSGANTLGHVAAAVGGVKLPQLQRLGLGNLLDLNGVSPCSAPAALYGRLQELSTGKDSTIGHWELAGLLTESPFPTYPDGFPAEIIQQFVDVFGCQPLGNIAASGTEVIQWYGEEHLRSGRPIVYTSVDSVFQVAAHEQVVPLEQLYAVCRRLRLRLDRWQIARVIARPFVGERAGAFLRTGGRHDFSLEPPHPTLLDRLLENGLPVTGIGKIGDLFAGRGLSRSIPSRDNAEGMVLVQEQLKRQDKGLIFANLVDFDMLWGHRGDVSGFAAGLEEVDRWLGQLLPELGCRDLLLITADHGCDPQAEGSDHTREYVPLLALAGEGALPAGRFTTRQGLFHVAGTIAGALGVAWPPGQSLLPA